ncbi:BLUF domain-containing protein [Litorimonas cladophorae]|uniref:BLUF domain-containing protein n=1 Tax=Litorimonas cladophorae TaxID=1220491 RepID=UPI0016791B1A|nr:BLUF domain-containing protein [Litorimonas cladophorae]
MVFQLIYTCGLSRDVSSEELEEIANSSRRRNKTRGITGILLYKDGSVLQVLEGERSAVLSLYKKIASDPRVGNVIVLIQRVAAKREFANWSMGFRSADQTEPKTNGAFKLCAESFPYALPQNPSVEVGTISRTFARVTGLV